MASLSKEDDLLCGWSLPSIPVLCYLSSVNEVHLSYVFLLSIFSSSLRSCLGSFLAWYIFLVRPAHTEDKPYTWYDLKHDGQAAHDRGKRTNTVEKFYTYSLGKQKQHLNDDHTITPPPPNQKKKKLFSNQYSPKTKTKHAPKRQHHTVHTRHHQQSCKCNTQSKIWLRFTVTWTWPIRVETCLTRSFMVIITTCT